MLVLGVPGYVWQRHCASQAAKRATMLTLHLRMAIMPTLRLRKATTAMTATMLTLHLRKIINKTAGVRMRGHLSFWHLANMKTDRLHVSFGP
jgi:hypothetical protein